MAPVPPLGTVIVSANLAFVIIASAKSAEIMVPFRILSVVTASGFILLVVIALSVIIGAAAVVPVPAKSPPN